MFWRRRDRLSEELEHHLAAETADNLARGLDPVRARNAAHRTIGNLQSVKEQARELDPLYWLDTLGQDARFACRLIARNRWTSLAIVLTLALGIGLNVSVFSVLNGLLLRPWVSHEPENIVSVFPRYSGQYQLRFSDGGMMSQPDYAFYRDHTKSLSSLGAARFISATLGGVESGSIPVGLVTCNVFELAGPAPPILGRHFTAADCARQHETPVVVLSEAAWRTRFNADRKVIGRSIHLNRASFTVIGVAPAFVLLARAPKAGEAYVPYTMLGTLRPDDEFFGDRHAHWLNVIGRRKPEYSLAQVQQELNVLSHRADQEVPGRTTALLVSDGAMIHDPDMRQIAPLLIGVTLGTATLLLLLGCVNVTTLLLSRAAARQREIAVRLSVGAGRFRLMRQLLTEGMVLSSIAAALSFLMAQWVPSALWHSLLKFEPPMDIRPDGRVLAYCVGVALVAGIIASLSPAFESLRPQLAESLKSSGGALTAGRRRSRLRGILVGVQVALSLIVLVMAALFTRSQRQFVTHDPGFETRRVVSVTLSSVLSGFAPSPSFYQELESRAGALPGVAGMGYTSIAPWSGRNSVRIEEIDGRAIPDARDFRKDPAHRAISPGYLALADIQLTRGRAFTAADPPGAVVISEAMAQRYWPGQNPLGHRFKAGEVREVVGVSRDVQSVAFMRPDGPFFYSRLKETAKPGYLMLRASSDPQATANALSEIVRQLDPQMATTVVTLHSLVEEQSERIKPIVLHARLAATLALILALTGVYGVVAFSVSQRVRELGIRLALGAQRGAVIWLVLRSGAQPVLGGLAAGVGLCWAFLSGLETLLFGLNPRDPLTLTVVPLLLLAAALVAIWIPARRAAALDPVSSLRIE
jgi:putative ABC transport system permease protein